MGLVVVFRRDKKLVLVLLLPLLLTLLASGLQKYPFYERLLVFLAPILILLVAWGAQRMAAALAPRWRLLLPVLVLAPPLFTSGRQVAEPGRFGGYKKSYFKEGLLFVNRRWQPGDVVYLYWNHESPYRYYKEAYGLKYTAVPGRDVRWVSRDLPDYIRNVTTDFLAVAGGQRAWFVCNDLVTGIGDIETAPAWYYVEDIRFGDEIRRSIARHKPQRLLLRQQWADAYLFAKTPAGRAPEPLKRRATGPPAWAARGKD
ncbi:hypothetical protein [Hymenobacter cellulosilyticus]|uniref:Uncharacterized protein n=1 Tax=Hymenobacter cellulosilyticus TaxID=2932248 RepID=A0A8T9Q6I5_9BACT|nr:hypothetical protein [Hymenobacter cellulosilyticus]UOQ70663.1 hypothetical protein MUN79_18395 [Hymenobacter cellulosilyticus]